MAKRSFFQVCIYLFSYCEEVEDSSVSLLYRTSCSHRPTIVWIVWKPSLISSVSRSVGPIPDKSEWCAPFGKFSAIKDSDKVVLISCLDPTH